MSNYRRWHQPGGTFFFTVVTYGRWNLFSNPQARQFLGEAIREVCIELPFETIAIVLLPDHLHAIWTLPAGDADFSTRWKKIKATFTERWLAAGGREMPVTAAQASRGNRGIWQRRFFEHLVDDETDLERHCDYIHYNPVKHGLARRPGDWQHSSFKRFVALGHYESDWGRLEPAAIRDLDYELYQ